MTARASCCGQGPYQDSAEPSDEWVRGFGLAVAEANRILRRPTSLAEVMDAAGLTPAAFKRAGLEEYDLTELRRIWRSRRRRGRR